MSLSDGKPPRAEAVLIARGPVGVEIQIVDTDYRVRARGTGEVKQTLPEGIYMVDWTSLGRTEQKIVRLLPISEPLVVSIDESVELQPRTRDAIEKAFSEIDRPSEIDHGSEVTIIIQGPADEEKIDLGASLRLLNVNELAMRSDRADAAAVQEQTFDGYVARFYRVAPGDFRLRYVSWNGQTLEQTVPAMRDRRTVVFVRAGKGTVLLAKDNAFTSVDYQGIDPSRTVIVSVPRSGSSSRPEECLRLAAVLLHDLAAGSGSLGSAFTANLDAVDADPLLLIYAASVVLTRLDRETSPALDATWPADLVKQEAFRKQWQDKALSWLNRTMLDGAPPDVTAVLWRLQAAGAIANAKAKSLSSPPMLECAWFWAVARSTSDPKAVPSSEGFRAVGRSGGGTTPWLTWRSASAKGDVATPANRGTGDLKSTIDAVASKVRALVASSPYDVPVDQSNDPLAFLSPVSRAVALRTLEVTEARSSDRSRKRGVDPATELAVLFSVPATELKQKLLHASEELDAALGPREASAARSARAASTSDPPALRRMIVSPDDSNAGRFGGSAKSGDFVLRAEFAEAKRKNKVRVTLTVECEKPINVSHEQVEFFLHDSYEPDRIAVPFRKGKATLAVNAWGGFTVGAWLAARGLELELNLATIPGAPRIMVER
jgi:hypothetical protein